VSHAGEGAVNLFDHRTGIKSTFNRAKYAFSLRTLTASCYSISKTFCSGGIGNQSDEEIPLPISYVCYPSFIPNHALGFIGIGLPLENTLISLRRLHSLAFGFETFAFRQKTELSRLSTVFQGNPIPVLTKYLGLLDYAGR
jgi:hypothetical protein